MSVRFTFSRPKTHSVQLRRRMQSFPFAKVGGLLGIWAVGTLLIVQLLYPNDQMLPFQQVDGVMVGAQKRAAATEQLNGAYAATRVAIYLGDNKTPVASPTLQEAGLHVENSDRVNALTYPLPLRFVPTSIFWARNAIPTPKVQPTDQYGAFVTTKLMSQCQITPQNATLKADGATIAVVPAKNGGECNPDTVKKEFANIMPSLTLPVAAHISMKVIEPELIDSAAKASADRYMAQVKDGVRIQVNADTVVIPATEIYSWLDFTPNKIAVNADINAERAKDYLNKNITPKVAVAPGAVTVTTKDFAEVSRSGGGDGRTLDLDKTAQSIGAVVRGNSGIAIAQTQSIPAAITYVRTYSSSDEGINALLTNFAKDHPGTYGISYAELSGGRRRANYQGDKKFVTASTYKLFVAYSVLKRVESGQMSWDENQACFNKMISYSDNACAEMFLNKIGLKTITNEINAMGLKNSNFMESGGPFTTPNDLVTYLGTLEGGTMFSDTSKQRLVSAMIANVYRNGIPAGASGAVADKVGFMDGLLHDAAIVYSPKGTYVLAVMTDGSSWGTIADLTRALEQLH